eukprot:3903905-Rhodomonas_salina.3
MPGKTERASGGTAAATFKACTRRPTLCSKLRYHLPRATCACNVRCRMLTWRIGESRDTPCVPFLHAYLRDITQIHRCRVARPSSVLPTFFLPRVCLRCFILCPSISISRIHQGTHPLVAMRALFPGSVLSWHPASTHTLGTPRANPRRARVRREHGEDVVEGGLLNFGACSRPDLQVRGTHFDFVCALKKKWWERLADARGCGWRWGGDSV